MRIVNFLLVAAMLSFWFPMRTEAKSYSSGGGHSYSSSSHSSSSGGSHSSSGSSHSSSGSSHSSSSGGGATHSSSSAGGSGSATRSSSSGNSGSKSFSSGSGKSYSSGSSGGDNDRHGYSSAKSYTSSPDHSFKSTPGNSSAVRAPEPARKPAAEPKSSSFTYDDTAARARKQEASKQDFTRFKEAQNPKTSSEAARAHSDSYNAKPPPIPVSAGSSYGSRRYIPDAYTVSSRPVRIYNVYNSYSSRPWVTYRDPYNSFFWWWLLDRSLDDRAWWTYHHRYDMDPARYEALVSHDQQLEARISQLEAQQAPRDPNYVPAGLDRDLMYSDHYVSQAYGNRPTVAGRVAFGLLGIPLALGACGFFIWLIWFKRWQTST